MDITRVKVNLYSGEIEFEGSEKFVENQLERLDSIVELLSSAKIPTMKEESGELVFDIEGGSENTVSKETSEHKGDISIPSSFGEWMHKFKDDLSDQEKCLVTAYYVQKKSQKNDFKTREVNDSLKEHGIKLNGTSTSLERLVNKKQLFQTRKEGSLKFMRVSKDGENTLKSLLRK